MSAVYSYNMNYFKDCVLDGLDAYASLHDHVGYNTAFVDRTGQIKIPIRTAVPPQLELPSYDPNFRMTYEECCQNRVMDILALQERADVPVRVFYSGGIDSSMVLASLIKQLGMAEAEKRIEIVMTMEGIDENPWMWERILRRSNFRITNSENHTNEWNTKRILVGGEFNDQLMGSMTWRNIKHWKGEDFLDKPWTADIIMEYLLYKELSTTNAALWLKNILNLLTNAPCPIETVGDWWWWTNFTTKWSQVYFVILRTCGNDQLISQDYLENYYVQFFGDHNFQRWAMARKEPQHDGSWTSVKPIPRRLVAEFMGEPEYLNKIKKTSLWQILFSKRSVGVIDDQYNYHWDIDPMDWYEPNHTFKL